MRNCTGNFVEESVHGELHREQFVWRNCENSQVDQKKLYLNPDLEFSILECDFTIWIWICQFRNSIYNPDLEFSIPESSGRI